MRESELGAGGESSHSLWGTESRGEESLAWWDRSEPEDDITVRRAVGFRCTLQSRGGREWFNNTDVQSQRPWWCVSV